MAHQLDRSFRVVPVIRNEVAFASPLSVFDMFRIGIGPSSSHTVGPMKAALAFSQQIRAAKMVPERIVVELFGSLGATGRGHATNRAVLLGLAGFEPQTVPQSVVTSFEHATELASVLCLSKALHLGKQCDELCVLVPFVQGEDILFTPRTVLPGHPNALTLTAYIGGEPAHQATFYSVGGGFVVEEDSGDSGAREGDASTHVSFGHNSVPEASSVAGSGDTERFSFSSAQAMLELAEEYDLSIAQMMRHNELLERSEQNISDELAGIWQAMDSSIDAGLHGHGILPGGLKVPRRAPEFFKKLELDNSHDDPLRAMDWINLYALAVNEENAAGHRVVTAPTNGAAGIIPAVIKYFLTFVSQSEDSAKDVEDFLLTAAAVGILIKHNASIAGAEVGCQGEVGSASAMAAAGLAQVLGGTPAQVENAAEIAMEHNLGLTCDPIGGLVQVPCIERNAIGAVKAVNAARMALRGDGVHAVSLDVVIETMRQTGLDMHTKYKETSTGGLAVNIVEC